MSAVFIVNMVSISMVMMAAIVLIILRDRFETQLIMAAVVLESIMALASLMWIEPNSLDSEYLKIRTIGRVIEAVIMWYVIVMQVRSIRATLLSPNVTEKVQQKIVELEDKVQQIEHKETINGSDIAH